MGDRPDPVRSGIRAGQNGQHARHRRGVGDIDRANRRMGVRRADHDRVAMHLGREIGDIGTLAGQQPEILDPRQSGADQTRPGWIFARHGHLSLLRNTPGRRICHRLWRDGIQPTGISLRNR